MLNNGLRCTRPAGYQPGEPLTLAMTLDSDLSASLGDGGLSLMSPDQAIRIGYGQLKVWDADGKPAAARMTLTGARLALLIDDRQARYPLTIDPTFVQQAYLKASNTDEDDQFGFSVAISGDTVVLGATGEDSNATGVGGNQTDNSAGDSGAAYVFVRSAATWSQQAYLKASNTDSSDRFGHSVAISGDSVVVGAFTEDSNATGVDGDQTNNSATGAGAAYILFKPTFTIGGMVSGLAGSGLVLQNNAGDDLPIAADGAFTFATPLADGSAYSVTVQTQPSNPSQSCTVTNGSGALAGANVTNVTVTCGTNPFTIGGTVSGLAGSGLVLQNNGGDDLPIAANGAFTFATALPDTSAYNVTVLTQPNNPSQTCTVGNGSGALAGANVTDVTVTCTTNPFTIGGTVSGLSGSGLVLQNNGGDDLPIAADGAFTFATPLADGSAYSVTVFTQPSNPSQTCTVGNGSGTLGGSNVTNISVVCQSAVVANPIPVLTRTGLIVLVLLFVLRALSSVFEEPRRLSENRKLSIRDRGPNKQGQVDRS